ncbi:MAG: diguanylate cyclase [Anaerolineaceae bacterium]|nr:MAG: diguanylate cyclase [Anaerolineaceae bacterium]
MKWDIFLHNNSTLLLISVIVVVCLSIIAMVVLLFNKLENEKKIAKSAIELNKLTNSIHAGLVHFIPEDSCRIYYASRGFFELLGYSKKEAKVSNKCNMVDFISSKDKEPFLEIIQNVEGDSISTEIRLVKKDGNVINCLMNGNYSLNKDGSKSVTGVIVDITEQKKMQEMLRMDSERYRIASELSHDVLFEYYIDNDRMVYTDKYSELFGRYPVISDYVKECYIRKDFVHPDDYGIFLEYCSTLQKGKDFVKLECRVKDRHNNYIWCQLMGKTIYDEENKPIRVIGKMVNIDYQKRELDSLEYKATRDPLTGVYNREVTIKKIEKYINGNKNGKHVLMFIDFDDFKKVNDTHGHLLGDRVLTHVIGSIKNVFTEGEIIGRIGGDEFAVFIGYIENNQAIKDKADTLIDALNTTYVDDNSEISISGSVGIATYPDDGIHYEQLIQCADRALYQVKSKGKNNYMLYNSALK